MIGRYERPIPVASPERNDGVIYPPLRQRTFLCERYAVPDATT